MAASKANGRIIAAEAFVFALLGKGHGVLTILGIRAGLSQRGIACEPVNPSVRSARSGRLPAMYLTTRPR